MTADGDGFLIGALVPILTGQRLPSSPQLVRVKRSRTKVLIPVVRIETVSHEHTNLTHSTHNQDRKIYSGSVQSPTYDHSRCHLEEDQLLLLTEDQLWLHIQHHLQVTCQFRTD